MEKEIDFVISTNAYNELYDELTLKVYSRAYKKDIAIRSIKKVVRNVLPYLNKEETDIVTSEIERLFIESFK